MGDLTIKKPEFELQIYEAKDSFLELAPKETWIKECSFALQQIKGNETLQRCNPDSFKTAIINVAMAGISLNPVLAQAFLIPRKGKCCLDISYRGLIKIALDSGAVEDIDATVVYVKDKFAYEMGLRPKLRHIPSMEADHGEMTHVYAVAVLKNGIRKFIVLNKAEVENIRKTSQFPNSEMWTKFYGEGCRKTAIKKLYKLLPQTDKLSTAISVVNEHEGIEFDNPQDTNAKELERRFAPPEAPISPTSFPIESEHPTEHHLEGTVESGLPTGNESVVPFKPIEPEKAQELPLEQQPEATGKATEPPQAQKRKAMEKRIQETKKIIKKGTFDQIRSEYPKKAAEFSMQDLVMLTGHLEKALADENQPLKETY